MIDEHETEVDPRSRFQLLLALGDAQRRAGEPREALPTLEKAAAAGRAIGEAASIAQAAIAYEEAFLQTGARRSPEDVATSLIGESLEALSEERPELRARLLAARARDQYFAGDVEHSNEVSELAVQVARISGDRGALLAALNARRITIWGPYDLPARLAVATEFVQLAEEAGHLESALEGHKWLITALIESGEIDQAEAEVERYSRDADVLQQPWFLYYAPILRSMVATLHGEFAEAEKRSLDAMAIGREAQSGAAVFQHWGQMLVLRWQEGRLDEMEQLAQMLREHFSPITGNPATVLAERGELELARREWEQLVADGLDQLPRDYLWQGTIAYWSVACHRVGDTESARRMLASATHLAGQFIVGGASVYALGAASRYLALLAEAAGSLDEAERLFEEALASNERIRAWPFLAATRLDFARMLLRSGSHEDHERAGQLLELARAAADTLGMSHVAAEASNALGELRKAAV